MDLLPMRFVRRQDSSVPPALGVDAGDQLRFGADEPGPLSRNLGPQERVERNFEIAKKRTGIGYIAPLTDSHRTPTTVMLVVGDKVATSIRTT